MRSCKREVVAGTGNFAPCAPLHYAGGLAVHIFYGVVFVRLEWWQGGMNGGMLTCSVRSRRDDGAA